MPVRTILKWPNPQLSVETSSVVADDPETRALARDLLDTTAAALGLGLAAPQVGVSKSVCIIKTGFLPESTLLEDPLLSGATVLVNPTVTPMGKEMFSWKEACLSVDGIEEEVRRYKTINLTYTDLTGNSHDLELHDRIAGVVQHETDHLVGKVFIDRLTSDKKRKVRSKIFSRKREAAARLKKELKRQKREEALEKAQNQEPPKPGFRTAKSNPGKSKRKRRPKAFGKNKRRKK